MKLYPVPAKVLAILLEAMGGSLVLTLEEAGQSFDGTITSEWVTRDGNTTLELHYTSASTDERGLHGDDSRSGAANTP
jgi:hypothetical protein